MDTFLVTEDAHRSICLQNPGGAASFVQEVHWLPVTTSFEDLGHRVFQGHGERCFNVAPARWILDGEEFLPRRSRLDVVFESGKLGQQDLWQSSWRWLLYGSSGLVCDLNWVGVGARTIQREPGIK